MNVLSLFDGISCGRVALTRAGIKVDNYYSSEIKECAVRISNFNHPQDFKHRLGDVTKIKASDLPRIDLLIGGSPCQDFSGANRERLGLEGDKSSLFYEFVRLLEELKPQYFLLENVRMKKEEQAYITNVLGVEPIVINSSLVSAQLRHRLYWTNIPNVTQPKDAGIKLNDILMNGYSDRDKARALLESDSRPLTTPIKMCHRYFNTGFTTLIFKSKEHFEKIKIHFDKHFKGKSAKYIDSVMDDMDLSIYEGVRYMNKIERARCQTIPNGYMIPATEQEAASTLGDGWTVDVIAHIFKGMSRFKVIIAGGRNFNNYPLLKEKCDFYLSNIDDLEVVCGGAIGADTLGKEYAKEKGYDVKYFLPNWLENGRTAGFIRNNEMAHYADGLIAFWDGKTRGTKNMIVSAKKRGLKVKIVRYE